jgi:CBS domain-containing protein
MLSLKPSKETNMPKRAIIKVIQNRDFIAVSSGTSVRQAAALMQRHHHGAIAVVNAEGVLVGICTERDLSYKVLAGGLSVTIGPEKPFGHALHLMFEGGFRHMPVIDANGRPLGILSARDALGLEILHFRDELTLREEIAELL